MKKSNLTAVLTALGVLLVIAVAGLFGFTLYILITDDFESYIAALDSTIGTVKLHANMALWYMNRHIYHV